VRDETAVAARLRAAGCVFAEDEARILLDAADTSTDLEALVAARCAGTPLEHVVGWTLFCGLRVSTAPAVFVPRRRTEYLVECAVPLVGRGACLVDLCCGTGAIGLAIATRAGPLELHAVDVDPAAVGCARANLAAVNGTAYCGDLFDALPTRLRGRVDVVVANAPYVPTDAIEFMPPEARLHEPRFALDGGADGLAISRRIIAAAPRWLRPGGAVVLETGVATAQVAAAAMHESGLVADVCTDEERAATVVIGRR
jgi:release factor glutamine methyltransferase